MRTAARIARAPGELTAHDGAAILRRSARVKLMRVGVPKEIKTLEFRVGLVPASVRELAHSGHQVFVETGAGGGIGFTDDDYRRAGATVLAAAKDVFDKAELVVKVKEPQPQECRMLREGQVLFTYLHL